MDRFKGYSLEQKEEFLDNLIETYREIIKKEQDIAEKLPESIPYIKELKDGKYLVYYDMDIWDVDLACKFFEKLSEMSQDSSFLMMPGIDLVELTDEEHKVINNILDRIKEKNNV